VDPPQGLFGGEGAALGLPWNRKVLAFTGNRGMIRTTVVFAITRAIDVALPDLPSTRQGTDERHRS
jgi:hypothetical protein